MSKGGRVTCTTLQWDDSILSCGPQMLSCHVLQEVAVIKSGVKCFGEPEWDPTFSKLMQHYQSQVRTSPATADEAIYEANNHLMEFDEDFECGGNERRREFQGWSHSLFVDDICLLAHSQRDIPDDEFSDLLEVTKLHYIEPGSACLILLFCLLI